MKKNYLLAFALSFLVLMAWQYFVARRPPSSSGAGVADPMAVAAGSTASGGSSSTEGPLAGTLVRRESVLVFEWEDNRVSVNRFGGGIRQWEIKEGDRWVPLCPKKDFLTQSLAAFPEVEYDVRQQDRRIVMSGRRADGLEIEQVLRVSAGYLHEVSLRLINRGKTPLAVSYGIGWGPGVEVDDESGRQAKGFQRALVFDGTKLSRRKAGAETGLFPWWGVDGHYFLAAFFNGPDQKLSPATLRVDKEDYYYAVHRMESFSLNPNETREDNASFYLGPKGYESLKSLGLGLERSVDFGYFAPFGRLIHRALFIFEKVTHNYGWAILGMTVLIQILVIPLTVKSFQHAQKMKTIQPQMKRLQELYKNDSRRLNSEMLALYQRHGLRFMGMEGCVPMLIQLPVFWALFSTLRNTYELRHAPWIGWITDLSVHDPYYVLPILMGGGMFLQQKMTMSSMDPSQKQIMYMMPLVFTFIFLKMPSGLVLYWLTNSLVTIAVQSYLMRRSSSVTVVKK